MVTLELRVEDVIGNSCAVEEVPVVAEDETVVCDEDVGVTSVGVEEVEGRV